MKSVTTENRTETMKALSKEELTTAIETIATELDTNISVNKKTTKETLIETLISLQDRQRLAKLDKQRLERNAKRVALKNECLKDRDAKTELFTMTADEYEEVFKALDEYTCVDTTEFTLTLDEFAEMRLTCKQFCEMFGLRYKNVHRRCFYYDDSMFDSLMRAIKRNDVK